jgi:hypothetical protein
LLAPYDVGNGRQLRSSLDERVVRRHVFGARGVQLGVRLDK